MKYTFLVLKSGTTCFIICCEELHREMMKFRKYNLQKHGYEFHIDKKASMKLKFGKSYKLSYFQVRESPAPLNIPTPIPAPDHRLGGHNELGGTKVE